MENIIGFFKKDDAKIREDDDFTDRLNHRYTVMVMTLCAGVVSTAIIFGDPIKCWAPVHFHDSHISYMDNYCWVRNTYYLPWYDRIPRADEERKHIGYYQWIAFILLTQGLMFYLPTLVWHGLNSKAGVDADSILQSANQFELATGAENRNEKLEIIQNQIHRFLGNIQKRTNLRRWPAYKVILNKVFCGILGQRFGSYLVCLYLATKILYIISIVLQFVLLKVLLGTNFYMYGIEVMKWLYYDDVNDWTTSPYVAFPRVTLCDFNVRRLGNVQRYTVQCTLPLNLYNEKIYMFLWFWMSFVAILTVFSFFQWTWRAVSYRDRLSYIKNHVKAGMAVENPIVVSSASIEQVDTPPVILYSDNEHDELLKSFVQDYLRCDGVFLLRLIGHNTNNITVTEIIMALWKLYQTDDDDDDEDDDNDSVPFDSNPYEAGTLPVKSAPPPDAVDKTPLDDQDSPLMKYPKL